MTHVRASVCETADLHSVAVETESETLDDETIGKLRAAVQQQAAHLPPEQQAKLYASFEEQIQKLRGVPLQKASLASVITGLQDTRASAEKLHDCLMGLARQLDRAGRGVGVFLAGEAAGLVMSAVGGLVKAAVTLEYAQRVLDPDSATEDPAPEAKA